jgi:hypothetical protein
MATTASLPVKVVRSVRSGIRDVADWWNSPIAGVELLVDNDASIIELDADTTRAPMCADLRPGFLAGRGGGRSSQVAPLADGDATPSDGVELVEKKPALLRELSTEEVQEHDVAHEAETKQARVLIVEAGARVERLKREADVAVVKTYAFREVVPVAWGKFHITGCGRDEVHRFSRLNPCCCAAPPTSPTSNLFFKIAGYARWLAVWIATWKAFDMFILVLIVLNSVLMALSDFSIVDASTLEPVSGTTGVDVVNTNVDWCVSNATAMGLSGCATIGGGFAVNNYINEVAEYVFTVLFTLEMSVKMMAMGVILDSGSYLRNGWNWLDFVVVVSGLAAAIPGMPKITVLRLFRLMRPLRSLNAIPELKIQVSAMLSALPKLGDVVTLLMFFMGIFAILALQLFSGKLHYRCRLTEFPVTIPYSMYAEYNLEAQAYAGSGGETMGALMTEIVNNRTTYPFCGDANGVALPYAVYDAKWEPLTSPWATSRDCVWPINQGDGSICNAAEETPTYGQPAYSCPSGTFCGSNYDWLGNSRFNDLNVMKEATWSGDYAFGYTMFDSLPAALVVIIQCITLEGWTDVMYMAMQSTGTIIPVIFFVTLVMLFSVFLMNFFLAVLFDEQEKGKDALERHNKLEAEVAKAKEIIALHDAGVSDATPAFDIFEVAVRLIATRVLACALALDVPSASRAQRARARTPLFTALS